MLRFDHVGVVVDDLDAVAAFFVGLGFERDGGAFVEGEAVDGINGLDGVRAEVVMGRTPDGSGRLELSRTTRRLTRTARIPLGEPLRARRAAERCCDATAQVSTAASQAPAARTVADSSITIERPIARRAARVELHADAWLPSRR